MKLTRNKQIKNLRTLTDYVVKEVTIDVLGSIGTSMAIIDSNEYCIGANLNLAMILNDIIGLSHSVRELTTGMPLDVLEPHERVSVISKFLILLPAARKQTSKPRQH